MFPEAIASGNISEKDKEMQQSLNTLKRDIAIRPHSKMKQAKKMWILYIMLIAPVAVIFVFKYMPMYGILLAFKDYKIRDGIWNSSWNNFAHFKMLFQSYNFIRVMRNTLIISLQRIVFGFPAPIIFAFMLNEITHLRYKKIVQTISYLPHFISWVVLGGIISEVLSPQRGIVNYIITSFGGEPIYFLTSKTLFRPILILTSIWQSVGWSSIIYLASLAAINPNLYEAAEMDGANRVQKAWHISLPSILPVVTIMFILRLGHILDAGFDQIFNLYNPLVYEVSDIIDTYVYRVGIIDARYDFTTAVGLFKNVIGITLILITNKIVKSYSEYGIW